MLGKITSFFTFSRFTLFVALCISAIAAWYSVIGLTAIFAGAVIPIMIMGGILEVAKITTTVWLHRYWDRASKSIKLYLTSAVIVLALLTSMGIFGLLSKAHLDQNVPSGDVAAKVSLFDEKIKTQRDNIDVARKALAQLDSQVEQRLARGDTEAGAERAVQIRRQQAPERNRLLREIADAQKEITKLNEERAPVASQLRKVEAEVGPIKYIAALIYGDNPDVTLLEKAVRWVTILIVIVFDPLAIVLILAANNSLKWERERREQKLEQTPAQDAPVEDDWQQRINNIEGSTPWPTTWVESEDVKPEAPKDSTFGTDKLPQTKLWPFPEPEQVEPEVPQFSQKEQQALLKFAYENLIEQKEKIEEPVEVSPIPTPEPIPEPIPAPVIPEKIVTDGVTKEIFVQSSHDDYVEYDGKAISLDALKVMHPELVVKNSNSKNEILFGTKFPAAAKKGDIYTRTDIIPHKVYKFNGGKWLELNKEQNTTYLQNIAYLQFLISQIDAGIYDPELLTAVEQDEISAYLNQTT